ncbi:MAG: hypothetical protein NVS9B15_25680 [Acidobacteriaceae bacterium]
MFWSVACAAGCALLLCIRGRRWAIAVVLVASAALGTLDAQLDALSRSGEATLVPYASGLLYTLSGTVGRAGLMHEAGDAVLQSVDIDIDRVDRYGDAHTVPSAVRVNVVHASGSKVLRYGMKVRLDAQLHEAQVFHDPGVWDRRAWLAQQASPHWRRSDEIRSR